MQHSKKQNVSTHKLVIMSEMQSGEGLTLQRDEADYGNIH